MAPRGRAGGAADDDRRGPQVDLHGLRPEQAQRRLEQELHSARVQGAGDLLVICGRGWGNDAHEPILRKRMEAWLRGPQGRERGVKTVRVTAKGGALLVRLR